MKINFIPKTKLGKWSVKLIIAFFLLFALCQIFVVSGHRGFGIPATIIPAGICGIASFFAGIIGIIKKKERSVFVFLATIIGLFILWFCIGEVLIPH